MISKIRFARFHLVGLAGFTLQLSVLKVLIGAFEWPTEAAVIVAVEAALLHNFFWHQTWTWGDRGTDSHGVWFRFLRFHGANGLVSLAGNAALTWAGVRWCRMPPVAANATAVGLCSLINCWLGDRWVFSAPGRTTKFRP
ncbi:MAG: hypothetical protein Kow001_04630 [Acidobacteriota bacterium]